MMEPLCLVMLVAKFETHVVLMNCKALAIC